MNDKKRILVLGNTGVGKTSFIHLLSHSEVLKYPIWTCGCNIELILHENHIFELWDIGTNPQFKTSRRIFYKEYSNKNSEDFIFSPIVGLILVHDLTNKKSYSKLDEWIAEVVRELSNQDEYEWRENEIIFGKKNLPLLLVGTKLDLLKKNPKISEETGLTSLEISNLSKLSEESNYQINVFLNKCQNSCVLD